MTGTTKLTGKILIKAKNVYRRLRAWNNARVTNKGLAEAKAKLEKGFAGKPHGLPGPLVVSLTSYPPRFPTLYPTLACLLTQSVRPDHVILWIAHADMDKLPDDVKSLQAKGLEIRETNDTGPFKKIIPALALHPDAFITTADDDVYYTHDWLEHLVEGREGVENRITFHRGHGIAFGDENLPSSYRDWEFCLLTADASPFVFPTGAGGVMYPPGIFDERVHDEAKFMQLCHRADDIWLYFMARLKGAEYKKVGKAREVLTWENSQDVALWYDNVLNDTNDIRIGDMIKEYGWPADDVKMVTPEGIDRKDLKSKSMNGAALNLTSQLLKFGLLFLNQIIMARFLTPEDFGLVAMVGPIMAFIVMFADLGLSQATIQRPKITQSELTFLFWTNVTVATTLALTVIAIAPLVALFYNEPRVMAITMVMGATLILSGLASQHTAIFTRNMEFKKIIAIDIGALLVGFTAGFIAALNGFDYWSLVVIHAVIYITNVSCCWLFSTWRPSRPMLPHNWKTLLKFGGNLSGFNFVNYFARNLDNVLIGRVNGEAALGLYDRAYKLLLMPLTQITQPFARIALPLLSRTLQDPELYRRAYLRMLEVIMLVTYPGVLYAVIEHNNLIVTVLGERWAEVAPIFAVLGAGSFVQTITHTTGWLFISQDRTRDMRNWGVFSSSVIIGSFFAGLSWGPLGVATAYLIVTTVQGPIVCWAATRSGPVRTKHLLSMAAPHLFSLAVTGAVIFATSYTLPKGLISIIVLLPLAYIVYGLSFYALPQGRKIIHELLKQALEMLGPKLKRFTKKPQEGI